MKAFFAGLSTAALLAIGGFFFVTVAMPMLWPKKASEVSVPATPAVVVAPPVAVSRTTTSPVLIPTRIWNSIPFGRSSSPNRSIAPTISIADSRWMASFAIS